MKKFKKIVSLMLVFLLSISSFTLDGFSIAAYAAEDETNQVNQTFTESQIAANGNVLYTANSGTSDTSVVPEGAIRGLYQSKLDQEFGVDEGTGLSWGYAPNDEYSVKVRGGDTSLSGSYLYISDTEGTYEAGKSGIGYRFQLPERADNVYEVTVGLINPWAQWGNKYEDIIIEDTVVEENRLAKDFVGTYDVTVTDGELNVFVQAHDRKSKDDDPILNYIIVKAKNVQADWLEVLKETIASCDSQMEGKVYTPATKAAYDAAKETAQKLIDEASTDTEAINAAKENMLSAFGKLVEAHIENYTSITGTAGERMYDNNGVKIQAHGGQIQQLTVNGQTKYYWIGEDRTNEYKPMPGVHLYSSDDLYNWTDEGVVLRTMDNYEQFETDEYFKNLYGDLSEEERLKVYVDLWATGCVMERPKMLYNDKTGKYVIWFHADGQIPPEATGGAGGGADYGKAKAGIAIADNPAGPYKLIGSYLLASKEGQDHSWDDVGGHVRDMNLFKDDDGTAYVMYSSEGNAVMYIARLNDEYTGLAKAKEEMVYGEDFCISSTDSREAPAMFKYDGMYYLVTSGCTGWAPNQARYAVAKSPLGPWKSMGDPCVGDSTNKTFSTQSTCVFPVDAANGKFVYMGDRWFNPDNGAKLSDSRYVWLPIEFGANNTIMIKDYSNWTLDVLDNKGKIAIHTDILKNTNAASNIESQLPGTIDVSIGQNEYKNTPVTWSAASAGDDNVIGDVAVTGTLTELNRSFTVNIFSSPEGLEYFVDCYTNNESNTSSTYTKMKELIPTLKNEVSDQQKTEDNTWGYTSVAGASGGGSSQDMGSHGSASDFYETGWWATDNGKIEYSFELEPGEYNVVTGYQEWWSATRGMKVTGTSVAEDGTKSEIGSSTFTLKNESAKQVTTSIEVPEGSKNVLITVSKASGGAPVLSWIGIIKKKAQVTEPVAYYVDSENGNDDNDGKSPETAWKSLKKASSLNKLTAGGKILLKAGSVWNGQKLTVKNAVGTKDTPIVIGSYGEGANPVINGNGANWSADTKEELAAVHVYNSENIIIENLEITNWDDSAKVKGSETYPQSSKLLSGLVVENRDGGELENVVIRNNKIHDVNGKMAGGADKAAGGLIVVVTGNGANHTGEVESYYKGLKIEGNEVYKVCHEAIYMESVWAARKLVGGTSSDTGYQNAGNSKWIGSKDVTIEHNYVHDVAGDGIVPINTEDCLVQYNLIDNSADVRWDYSANPNHAALWTWDTNNVTFRYNEACNTSKYSEGKAVGNDSMAFDFDYGVQNCVYEYNYSHDNLGGFLMLCPGPGATVNNIARYNISVNDGKYDGAPIIRVGGGKYGSNGVQVYNNTIYWGDSGYEVTLAPESNWEGSIVTDVSIFNNIFYGPTKAGSVKTSGVLYSNNAVGGGAENVLTADIDKKRVVMSDLASFADVKAYTTGSFADGKVTLGTVNGLMLQKGSVCIGAGMAHPDAPASAPDSVKDELVANPALKPVVDYANVELGTDPVDIGAYKFVKGEEEYTITYEGLKATDSNENPSIYTENSDDIILKDASREEYVFEGWYADADYTTKVEKIEKGSKGNKVFYAKWREITYTITYDVNAGVNNSKNPTTYTKATKTITLKNPTKRGYLFEGWYTDEKFTKRVTKIVKGSTGDKKLHAKWSKKTYTITYDLNAGVNSSKNRTHYTIQTPTFTFYNPTRKGYAFEGWYLDSEFTKKVTEIERGSIGNKKLHAKWSKKTYTITYYLNGGKNSSKNRTHYTIRTATFTFYNPTRTGYTFKGWYLDSKFTKKVTEIEKGSTGNKKLYAKWTVNKYNIQFIGNGSTSGKMSVKKNCRYDRQYTLTANAFKKKGYTFVGWNTKKDGKGKSYKNCAKVEKLSSKNGATVTLYAIWAKKK